MNNTKIRSRVKTTHVSSSVKSSGNTVEITPPTTTKEQVRVDSNQGGYVVVEGGITKNLGEYNSAKIAVSVCLPCGPTIADAEEKYKEVSVLVDKLINAEYDKVLGGN